MKKLNAPEGYEIYHVNEEKLYALDKHNMDLIEKEFLNYQSYLDIPNEKEVESYAMDFDEKSNSYNVNFNEKVNIKMSRLSSLAYNKVVK